MQAGKYWSLTFNQCEQLTTPQQANVHTHTQCATGWKQVLTTLYTLAFTHALVVKSNHVHQPCLHTHTHSRAWHSLRKHTTQPDTPNSLNKRLMLPLWYLPLHHCHFISQSHYSKCASIVILAVCWKCSSHNLTVIGWKQSHYSPALLMAHVSVFTA